MAAEKSAGQASEHLEGLHSVEDVRRAGSVDATEDAVAFKEAHAYDSIEYTKPGPFIWMCAAATAIGGALFGYDTGVISGVLVVIGSDLNHRPLSDTDKELITTLCAAGAFIGALVAGITADKFGRKPAAWFASVLFTIGALIQATSYTIAQMSIGRLLIGLGVGSASMVCASSFFIDQ
jgi:SP family myo-inositol transporter-like MFS transporter 13